MERVRIVDVAAAAEVSRATVTNALNGTGRMSAATRAHVREVAAALGYRRPRRALGLAVPTRGDLCWDFASVPYYAEIIGSAMAAAHRRGYSLTVLPAGGPWRSLLHNDGVLLLDPPAGDPVTGLLRDARVPLGFVGRPVEPDVRGWVDNDHRTSVRLVLDHLAGQGARRVALIAGPGEDHYSRACVAAYLAWCREHGRQALVEPHGEGHDPGEALLARRDPPDAVYGIYESAGRVMLDAARRYGLRVPADLMVACFSEDPAYAGTDPPVTTLSHHARQGGRLAAEALLDHLETHTPGRPTVVPTCLTERASSLPG